MTETKPTNPKDAVGSGKVPLSLIPATAQAHVALAHLDGALKYGAWNWRHAGVRASIYLDACMRHLADWQNGEDFAEDSEVHHLAHAIACLNILLDSIEIGKLVDDRPPRFEGMPHVFSTLAEDVQAAKTRHADKNPHHYTINDTIEA